MQTHWGYLIHDNLVFWKPHLKRSADAIRTKLMTQYNLEVNAVDAEEHPFEIVGFIDCNVTNVSRPGGGPMGAGAFARRWPRAIQVHNINCRYKYIYIYIYKYI